MTARIQFKRFSKVPDPFMHIKREDLRSFSAALGVAAVFLIWGLWTWDRHIDPLHAPDVLGLHLLMGVILVAYPIALLAGVSFRVLPYLFYSLLLATQAMFMLALAHLTGGLSMGGSGLLFWFLVPPLMAGIFTWKANLIGNLLLLIFPNLLAALFGSLAGFDPVKFNLLAVPAAAIAFFISHFIDSLMRRIYELRKQVEWRTTAMDSAGESMHVTDRNGTIEYVNPAFCSSTGYTADEAIGTNSSLLKSGVQDEAFYENLWTTILRGEIWQGEIVNRCKGGSSITLSMTISPVLGLDGLAEKFIAISHDITARKMLEEEVALGHAELEAIFNNAGGGIALFDLWGHFIKVNDFWLGMLGYTREAVSALSHKNIFHDDDVEETQQLFVALASGEIPQYESDRRFVCNGGRVFWGHLSMTPVKDEDGYIRAIIAIVQDINERKLLEDKLEAMAHYDALTALPNRALFFDRLGQAISQTKRSQGQFALMFVDLDGFKAVNDTFGHDTGDAVLKAVSEHLLECVRESDTVARMGGDEFTIILRAIRGAEDAAAVAEKILAALAPPLHLLGHECRIGASLGIVLYPQHGSNAEELLSQADNAMYAVKKAGKNAYRFAEDNKKT